MKLKKAGNYTDYKNIWIIAEVENSSSGIVAGDINPVTHEIAGRGRLLADSRGSELWIIIAGDLNGRKNYKDDFFYADRIIIADDKRLSGFHDETESALINRMISKYRPEIVLFSATVRGRSLAPVLLSCQIQVLLQTVLLLILKKKQAIFFRPVPHSEGI